MISTYNAERWLDECMGSALAQTWSNREIIGVNDGSTDRTLSIAKRHSQKDVGVISERNQGAGAARNIALSVCRGDYIQWLVMPMTCFIETNS